MPEQGPTPALCCSYCGKPASCIGKADDGHGWAYACDECCGHGNEDSCCYPLSRIPAEWNRRDEVEEKAEKEEDAARARHLREAVEGLRDGWISGAVHRYITGTVYADSADRFRAALLDALTGEK